MIKKTIYYFSTAALLVMLVLGGVLVGVGLTVFFKSGASSEELAGKLDILTKVLDQPVPISDLKLTDHNGNEFTEKNFEQKWTFLFFGYTYCPEVCPATMDTLNGVYDELQQNGELINTEVVFVSVDPKRDSVKQLAEYVPYFNKKFVGVTGKEENIKEFANKLGVAFSSFYMPDSESDDDYEMNHNASILLIDPLGRQLARFSPPHRAGTIAADFRKIREQHKQSCCIASKPKFDFKKKSEKI